MHTDSNSLHQRMIHSLPDASGARGKHACLATRERHQKAERRQKETLKRVKTGAYVLSAISEEVLEREEKPQKVTVYEEQEVDHLLEALHEHPQSYQVGTKKYKVKLVHFSC